MEYFNFKDSAGSHIGKKQLLILIFKSKNNYPKIQKSL